LSNGLHKSFRVEGVRNGRVVGVLDVNGVVATVEYAVRELSARERFQRMGAETDPAVALVKGQMAFVAKAYAMAVACFKTLPEELARRLVARVAAMDGASSAVTPPEEAAPPAPAEERPVPRPAPGGARALNALRRVPVERAGETAQKVVADLLAANRQLADVDIGLFVDAGGALAGVEIRSPDVHNLGPLSGVPSLCSLVCGVPGRQTVLGALVPLRGLPLERLGLAYSAVKDLSSLRGMSLVDLDLSNTQVTEIGVLRGMPIERLSLNGTAVRDLSALRGMPLTSLDISGTPASDFLPLAGLQLTRLIANGTQLRDDASIRRMPLRELDVGNTRLHTFDWLQKMPMEVLNLEKTQIRSLDPLKGKRLRHLNAAGTGIGDIAVLRDMPLAWLSLADTAVSDLAPLAGAPLRELNVSNTAVQDIGPLRKLPIESLNLEGTPVDDLSPLEGMPLRNLNIQGTKVRDLAVVGKLALVSLDCRKARVRDYHALARSTVQDLWVDTVDEDVKRLFRRMPRLRAVNGVPRDRW